MVASLYIGCHIEGSYGAFFSSVCNLDDSQVKRQKRQWLEGTILEASGEKRWLVRFDLGLEKECSSASLKLLGDPRYNRLILSISIAPNPVAVGTALLPSIPAIPMPPNPAAVESVATALIPSIPDILMPPNPATVELVATAWIPSIPAGAGAIPPTPAILIPPNPEAMESAATALLPSIPAGAAAIPSISALPMSPNFAAMDSAATALMPLIPVIPVPPNPATVEAVAPIPEASVQEDLGEEVDLHEADDETEQENDEDAGLDVVDNITADVHQQ
jgi:hypothetical protein